MKKVTPSTVAKRLIDTARSDRFLSPGKRQVGHFIKKLSPAEREAIQQATSKDFSQLDEYCGLDSESPLQTVFVKAKLEMDKRFNRHLI
jgi:hypothetical protein